MYRHCTFCSRDLGANQVLEAFPVGRRLAFDSDRGRLWVVCPTCERWNLTPLEERWEAVEGCERHFRETRLRVSSENVGLARLKEGLELVRIGDPLRPELAAWRYGDQFGRRRRRAWVLGSAGALVAGGVVVGSVGLAGLSLGLLPLHVAQLARQVTIRPLSIPSNSGERIRVQADQVGHARIRPVDGSWQLEVRKRAGAREDPEIITGPAAVEALGTILPRVNRTGGRKDTIKDAVRELEEVGDPQKYFHEVEYRARKLGWGYAPLQSLPAHIRLALEMGAHEDQERTAAQGELARLEARWREAEEIAAIADDLVLPEWVRASLLRLKRETRHKDPVGEAHGEEAEP